MPEIILKNITKKFGNIKVVKNLNLKIEDRDFVVLLGPSGCGKTTTLRMIAGLETPSDGEITIDGEIVFSKEKNINLPPNKRKVGFLFQNYALWPHMTVYQNISFGLENLKWKKDKIKNTVSQLARLLRIEELLNRYPSEISGGQQQRVAIARTLAPNPKVLLMDEPLSNLDAKLRMEMRTELKRLHTEIKSTFVYVTHDQLEAMTLATKVCLINYGVLQQVDSPLKIYDFPENIFVADFIGNPGMNLLEVKYVKNENGSIILENDDLWFEFYPSNKIEKISSEEKLVLGIRPEDIELSNEVTDFSGEIYSTLPSGKENILKIKIGDSFLTAIVFGRRKFLTGNSYSLSFKGDKYLLFNKKSRLLLTSGRILHLKKNK